MKFTIEQADFSAALLKMDKVVKSKTTIPILKNVLIKTSGGKATFTGTDLDIEVTVTKPVTTDVDGETTVRFDLLKDAVSKYSKGGLVKFEVTGNDAIVSCGRSRGKFPTTPAEDFPHMASAEYDVTFKRDAADVGDMFAKVGFAQSTEETRYYLNGVFMHIADSENGKSLRCVATDGHRLALIDAAIPDGAADMPGVIVPRMTVAALALPDSGEIDISVSETKIRFSSDDWSLVSKVVDGTFPDYARVIPSSHKSVMRFDGAKFKSAVAKVVISDGGNSAVRLAMDTDGIGMEMKVPNIGEKSDFVDGVLDGDPVEIGFNYKYLISAVSCLDGAAVFEFTDGGGQAVMKDDADPDWLCVLMPMRV